jgi:L-ascorbate metabolism protein UlaG (beta-lactamase superfamily)
MREHKASVWFEEFRRGVVSDSAGAVARARRAIIGQVRIIKFTHACVRIEDPDAGVLVIDPGIWTEAEATAGVDAVLITHWHSDHVDVANLDRLGVPVYAPDDPRLAERPGRRRGGMKLNVVEPRTEFRAAGFNVQAVGGRHAFVYDGLPDIANLGYIVEDSLYHPGDSFFVPAEPIDTLLVPAQASWMMLAEAIEFVRAVNPERAFAIHDGQINERGLASVNDWLGRAPAYRYLAPGETA